MAPDTALQSDIRESILDTIGEHAAGAPEPHRRRPQAAGGGEDGALQPRRLDQGSRRAAPDRGGRARREPGPRRHDRRADLGQHGHRSRDRRAPEGLPRDRGDARQDVAREDRPAARLRGRGRDRADRRRARVAAVLLPRRGSPDRGDPGRLPAQPVPQSRQPADALRHHRPGAVAPDRRAPDAPRRRRRNGRHDHRHGALPARAEPGAGRRRRRSGRLDLLGRRGPSVPGRGRGRGLLADAPTTRRWSTATCASATATASSPRAVWPRSRGCSSAARAASPCMPRWRSRASSTIPRRWSR